MEQGKVIPLKSEKSNPGSKEEEEFLDLLAEIAVKSIIDEEKRYRLYKGSARVDSDNLSPPEIPFV